MRRAAWIGVGVAVLAGGIALSRLSGSTPEAPTGGPLAACGADPNCARVHVAVAAPPDDVRAAARQALEDDGATDVEATDAGWTAAAPIWPFTDDVQIAVEADGAGSVLWIRSASRVGKSDLGVNTRRARRLVEAVRRLTES